MPVEILKEGQAKQFENALIFMDPALETAFEADLALKPLLQWAFICPNTPTDPYYPSRRSFYSYTFGTSHGNGAFLCVPREFELYAGTLRVCPGQPPLRLLTNKDMATRRIKVCLAELQRLMHHIESL
ncbi:hypothetical protein GN244_ATG17823 [Phytophthora infestans]|uniref:Uncharacterized protein n=1 Tax=Phytophthora infestans TaxID=4787 RepID=A0A833SIN8_PHYIN|nr:hypothetical protein GN244_ATG17823 [Phytophthora infestans]